MSDTDVVCVTPGRKDFEWQVLDGAGIPVNIAGGAARWQGKSDALPPVIVAGCSTNSSITLTRATGSFIADGVTQGMKISGTTIAAGAVVSSVGTTTLVMTLAATGTNAGPLSMTFVHDIDVAAVIADAPNGIFRWTGINAYVAAAQLNAKKEAAFKLRCKFTDSAGKNDYSDEETWTWHAPPV